MGEGFDIIQFLKSAVAAGASDEHLVSGNSPMVRINGYIRKANMPILSREEMDSAILEISPTAIKNEILSLLDVDFVFKINGCSRFRVNYHRTMGNSSLTIRNIPYKIPCFDDLSLPPVLSEVMDYKNGIVLVTGPTGSGKSTTLAALIDSMAKNTARHIITIEDPVEHVFSNAKSLVTQRQIGIDTQTFADGLKYALRQDPDVIFIGEIRDAETMEAALKAAETGHLVFSTLHTNDAVQTINRVINFFEEQSRPFIRKELAETLRVTVAQKLVLSTDGTKRYPACEIMTVTPAIKDYIIKDNPDEIYNLLKETNIDNIVSMNQSLLKLVNEKLITEDEALSNSNDSNELEKMLQGIYQGTKGYYE